MKIVPKRDQILGRTVDLNETSGGIVMPDMPNQKATVFMIVDDVGPAVIGYKAGDIVLPEHFKNIHLKGGRFHRIICKEEDILAGIEDVPRNQFTIKEETSL